MRFTKMHGAGNDYVYVDCTKDDIDSPSEVARIISDRHFGIGSDGLILIKASDKADFFMEMYNADGSQAQMCGNGIRCVAKYVYDNGLTDKTHITVDTLAGVKTLDMIVDEDSDTVTKVTVNMGAPTDMETGIPLMVNGKKYTVTKVSMGNPHCVIFVEDTFDLENFQIEEVGPLIEHDVMFPERTNVEFVQVKDRVNLNMRVWERGSGETLACGTGACASLVAAVLNGLSEETATLHLLGGDLLIHWDKAQDSVFMVGPAATVFTGTINVSALMDSYI